MRFFTDLLRFSCSAEFVAEWAEQNSNQIFEFVSSQTLHTCALHQIELATFLNFKKGKIVETLLYIDCLLGNYFR